MTSLVEVLFISGVAILAAIVIVGFFVMRDRLQKKMLNRSKDK